jgi:hypothetical protein
LKCEKSNTQCPGYRNLHEIQFRDESERVIRKARKIEQPKSVLSKDADATLGFPTETEQTFDLSIFAIRICHSPSQSVNELGANFFFAKYTFNDVSYPNDFHAWLAQSYHEVGASYVLRAAVEAVGMAGMSNIFHAPYIASKSKQQYGEALVAMKQALNNPVQAIADTTFTAVILFGLFEVCSTTWQASVDLIACRLSTLRLGGDIATGKPMSKGPWLSLSSEDESSSPGIVEHSFTSRSALK